MTTAVAGQAELPPLRPARPLPPMIHQTTRHTPHSITAELVAPQQRVQCAESDMQNPPKNEAVAEFRCSEKNRQKVRALLYAAFPANSDHAVSQRAALNIGRDARTIRSWMEGRTVPNWDEMMVIGAYAGIERALQIILGGRR